MKRLSEEEKHRKYRFNIAHYTVLHNDVYTPMLIELFVIVSS